MDKSVDIFIKTYLKDFKLLQIALKTISKNVSGYRNVVLLIPEKDKHEFDTRNLPERTLVHYVPDEGLGWLRQQWYKMSAYNYSDAEYILFSDSDNFFDHKINVQELVNDEKPEILFTDYKQLPDAQIWQKPTSDLIGEPQKFEFMRRLPLLYHRSTLVNIGKWKPDLEGIIMTSHRFSEFNLIGAYANKFEHEKYTWTNTDGWTYVQPHSVQVWSHATEEKGTDEIHLREFIKLLKTIMKCFDVPTP